ncbi:MAG: 4-(cytidine 5'-diphospho)-2-C-methyl-D-erythritol kinase [Candidatus Pelagibacter sp.]|nr:4-(cytidine 5'-diphospho)-2-C-methyl-D-erythritol kinase [Candidatus Pelagibacter sp.]
MSVFKIKSYAKINLALNVIGKNAKLHKVESLISFINLYDLIYIKKTKNKDHKIIFNGKFSKNINKINTISTLLKLLDTEKLLNHQKFQIKIKKNIPHKAGLGGGSMNAASLINFFINKKILKIKNEELKNLTAKIGSDVILGIRPTNTILSSNGKIKKFDKKIKLYVLVVKPEFGCSTKYIYSKVNSFSKPQFNSPQQKMFKLEYLKTLNNDLEKIALNKYPKLNKIKSFLVTLPNIKFVRMSGSGSSIVAYFHSQQACSNAYRQFKRKFNSHWCIESKTI